MAHVLFDIGRCAAFLGVFFFLLFGLALWMFRRALDEKELSLIGDEETREGEIQREAIDMSGTVLYLRRRDYIGQQGALEGLGQQYRERIIWPFYLGVWSFCSGLALMSVTFGFVLFD